MGKSCRTISNRQSFGDFINDSTRAGICIFVYFTTWASHLPSLKNMASGSKHSKRFKLLTPHTRRCRWEDQTDRKEERDSMSAEIEHNPQACSSNERDL